MWKRRRKGRRWRGLVIHNCAVYIYQVMCVFVLPAVPVGEMLPSCVHWWQKRVLLFILYIVISLLRKC